MLRKIVIGLGAALILVLGYAFWPISSAPTEEELAAYTAKARTYDVTIHRDDFGVPHIYGKTTADVAFGLGYANAEDDYATTQDTAMAMRGRLSAYKGMDTAPMDFLVQALGVWPLIDAKYDSDEFSQEARDVAEAYADALNLYAARHPEQVWPGVLPYTGKDILAGIIFKLPLFYRLDMEVIKLLDPTGEMSLVEMETRAKHYAQLHGAVAPLGSNAMAVAPKRSADGATRLFVNSHQPFEGPVAWYEARLKSEDGLDIAGGTFPGFPMIGHGVRPELGWAFTVNKPDLTDVYELTVNPDNPDQYMLDGEWRDFEKSEARITIKLLGNLRWTVTQPILKTLHGPAIAVEDKTYAVRYASMGEVGALDQFIAMNKATSFEDWTAAMNRGFLPSFNVIYADRTGKVAFYHNASLPNRKAEAGLDWTGPVPGDRSDLIWTSSRGMADNPQVVAPESGFVFSSNNSPFTATDGPDNDVADRFDGTEGFENNMTNRALRQLETYGADEAISRDEFIAYKFDLKYSQASEVAHRRAAILEADLPDDPIIQEARALLAQWDLSTDRDNIPATVGVLGVAMPLVNAEVTGKDAPPAAEAFVAQIRAAHQKLGRLDIPFGDINRMVRGSVDIPLDGGPDIMRAIYDLDGLNGSGKLEVVAGDTLIMMAEWLPDGGFHVDSIHQFGSAATVPDSPHYADQTGLFAAHDFRVMHYDFEALKPTIKRSYHPAD